MDTTFATSSMALNSETRCRCSGSRRVNTNLERERIDWGIWVFGGSVRRAFGGGGVGGSLDGRAKVGDEGDNDSALSESAGRPAEVGVCSWLSGECRRTRDCLSASGECERWYGSNYEGLRQCHWILEVTHLSFFDCIQNTVSTWAHPRIDMKKILQENEKRSR
jgi:hypothetical protein